MKTLITVSSVFMLFSSQAEPYKYMKDTVIYEAVVKGKKVSVIISEAPFVSKDHKITPARVEKHDGQEYGVLPMVDGHTIVGSEEITHEETMRNLSRLAVSFDGKIVDAPKELISHVFMPHKNTSFNLTDRTRTSMISISSDAKTVVIDLAVGDGCASGHVVFSIAENGKTILGAPEPPSE